MEPANASSQKETHLQTVNFGVSLKLKLINQQVLPKHFVRPHYVDQKRSLTKNILKQKHQKNTDSSWWFQPVDFRSVFLCFLLVPLRLYFVLLTEYW